MAADLSYPHHEDAEWLAVDRDGLIARFTTGGAGPIPRSALLGEKAHRAISEAIQKMAPRCVGEVVVRYSNPSDFISCAERGLFAYDWSDVHRVKAAPIRAYELISRPATPLPVDWLLEEFDDAAEALPRFPISFREALLAPTSMKIDWILP